MDTLDWIAPGVMLLLVNAVWQVAFVGAMLWGVLRVGRVRSPQWRYGLCVAGLMAIVVCPVLTALAPRIGLQLIGLTWRSDAAANLQPIDPRPATMSSARATNSPVSNVDGMQPMATWSFGIPLGTNTGVASPPGSPAAIPFELETSPHSTPVDTQISMPSWLVLAYGLGVLLMLVRLAAGQISVGRLLSLSQPVAPPVSAVLEELRARAGVTATVGIRQSDRICGPVLLGIVRPVVLIPSSMLVRPGCDVDAIILHELAHVHRRDAIMNLFERLTLAVLFFHPVVWLLRRELHRQREYCCDAWVIAHTGREYEYARCLTDLAQRLRAVSRPMPSLAMAEFRHELPRRIAAVLDGSVRAARTLPTRGFVAVLGAALGLAVLISACGVTSGVDRDEASRPAVASDEGPKAGSSSDGAVNQEKSEVKADASLMAQAEVGPGELAGVVVDDKGEPLERVLVDVWTWYSGNETRTGKDGRFRLGPFQDQQTVEVRFSKPGYSPDHIAREPLGEPGAVFTLGNKTYFEGRVLGPDDKPVANALIRADQGPAQAEGVVVTTVWTEARSDEQGRYRMYVDGDPDTYDIQVKADGVGVARLPDVEVNKDEATPLDIRLERGVTFRAAVLDSQTKEPVAGVRLHHWQHPGVEGRAGDDGIVAIDGMMPGKFEFQVDAPGYARWWSEACTSDWARFKIDESRGGWQRNFDDLPFDLDLDMEPVTILVEKAVTIRGKVLDPDGKPVAGATVAPALTGTGNSITGDTRYSFQTGDKGEFEMRLPASNEREYNLIVHDGKYDEWRTWANGVADPIRTKPGQVIEDVFIKLTRPATVRGKVVDEEGRPVADRQVRAQGHDKLENRYYDPQTRTTDDGSFELKFIRPGKHYIQVHPFWLRAEEAPEPGTQIVTVAAGETVDGIKLVAAEDEKGRLIRVGDRKIPLPAATKDGVAGATEEIKGVVVDEKGKPVAGASITLVNGELATRDTRRTCAGGACFISSGPVYMQADGQGRFKFSQLLAGESDIEVRQGGYQTAFVRDAATGEAELHVALLPARAYKLSGSVRGADGEPLFDAEVMLVERWHGGGGSSPRIIRARSTANGSFAFPDKFEPVDAWGLLSRTLLVRKDGHAVWGRRVDSTGAEAEVVVELSTAAEANGRIVKEDEQPVADAEVWAWIVNTSDLGRSSHVEVDYWQIEELAPRTRTNEKGEFRIKGLPVGAQLSLFVQAPGYAQTRRESKAGEPGADIELEREVILRGVVVYEKTGEPAAKLQLGTQGLETAAWAATATDAEGRFELRNIKPEPTNLFATIEPPARGTAPDWAVAAIVFKELEPGNVKGDLKFVLTKGGVIRGKVTDAAGHPLKDIDIAFYSAARPRGGAACQVCYSGDDGTWAYRFPPGEVYVYIRTNVQDSSWSRSDYTLQLKAGQTIDSINFKLNREVPADSPHRLSKQADSSG